MATKPSILTTTIDPKKVAAEKMKFLQEITKGNFDPEKKREEIKTNEEQIEELQKANFELKKDLSAYYRATDQTPPADLDVLTPDEIEEKIRAVMPNFLAGADGKLIANAIGDHRITTDTVSKLYWTEKQTVLRKEGKGMTTKYFIATADDAEAIEKSKETEKAEREAQKAKRAAKKS